MDEQQIRQIKQNEARVKEMTRFWQDTIRIFNPLDEDFVYYHDGYANEVKKGQYKDVPRYKARLFFRKISQRILDEKVAKEHDDMLKTRDDRGMDKIRSKYEESMEIWMKTLKKDDPKILEKIANDVVIGLVEEYGKETNLPSLGERLQPKPDLQNPQEIIFKNIASRKVDKELPVNNIIEPLQAKEVENDNTKKTK